MLRHSPIPAATWWDDMSTERLYVVDQIEGEVAVLIDEDQRSVDAPLDRFQLPLHEGLALRVPIGDKGAPQWGKAEIDRREADIREAEETLEELRGRDPGGDVKL